MENTLELKEIERIAIENLIEKLWKIRKKYYGIRQPVQAILDKMKLDKKNKLFADCTVSDLSILIERLEEITTSLKIENNTLKYCEVVCKKGDVHRFLIEIFEKVESIIFYMGKVSARLEIASSYQDDARDLVRAISLIINNFFKKD